MKMFYLLGIASIAIHCWGGTIIAPGAMENLEGDTTVGGLFGGDATRTQILFDSRHFSVLAPEGAYFTEMSFRLEGGSSGFSGIADLEIHFSTTSRNSEQLSTTFSDNIGLNEKTVFARSPISLTGLQTSPSGPNSFSVVIPLPTQFLYRPADGNLLVDTFVYSRGTIRNLDWQSGPSSGISIASGAISASSGFVSDLGPITQFQYVNVPEPRSILLFALFTTILLIMKCNVFSRRNH